MVQYGRPGRMHPVTESSIRAALFDPGEFELTEVSAYGDEEGDWDAPGTFGAEPSMEPCDGWVWHNHSGRVAEGTTWGGNIEVLSWLLMADRAIPDHPGRATPDAEPVPDHHGRGGVPEAEPIPDQHGRGGVPEAEPVPDQRGRGGILFLETSEELPSGTEVYRILRAMGERGLLGQFSAVLFGRPKAWALDRRNSPEQKTAYRADLRQAVLRGLAEYAPDAMAVFDVDFGHTDPQLVIPYGGQTRVDGTTHRITVHY